MSKLFVVIICFLAILKLDGKNAIPKILLKFYETCFFSVS